MLAAYLRQCAVVPDVSLVRESVTDKTKFPVFCVLLDGIEEFITRDLVSRLDERNCSIKRVLTDLKLRVCPSRNFHDHVEDVLVLVAV